MMGRALTCLIIGLSRRLWRRAFWSSLAFNRRRAVAFALERQRTARWHRMHLHLQSRGRFASCGIVSFDETKFSRLNTKIVTWFHSINERDSTSEQRAVQFNNCEKEARTRTREDNADQPFMLTRLGLDQWEKSSIFREHRYRQSFSSRKPREKSYEKSFTERKGSQRETERYRHLSTFVLVMGCWRHLPAKERCRPIIARLMWNFLIIILFICFSFGFDRDESARKNRFDLVSRNRTMSSNETKPAGGPSAISEAEDNNLSQAVRRSGRRNALGDLGEDLAQGTVCRLIWSIAILCLVSASISAAELENMTPHFQSMSIKQWSLASMQYKSFLSFVSVHMLCDRSSFFLFYRRCILVSFSNIQEKRRTDRRSLFRWTSIDSTRTFFCVTFPSEFHRMAVSSCRSDEADPFSLFV